MLIVRLSKSAFVAAIALFATLVAVENIFYSSINFAYVHHVFLMDSVFADAPTKWRSIENITIQNIGYWLIVTFETLTAILCWIGSVRMLLAIKAPKNTFQLSKRCAIAGLTLGFLVWHVAFMSVGGEWFGMWMSKEWNGVPDAFRFFITIILVLIYVVIPDDKITADN
ncbi:DUF2165 family protein [Bartonella choladocola]|uniref:Small integral membrane protein n=1 Tax=Bartonella choladocola TaxID=2750995 RepID=A0A1U9MGM9_9HYPH|nr:DUF2165 domain-containing protein [Bartonella choladocola]AQT46870.1 putative small integral membrane protein [Bartonella choladocola]